MCQLNIENDVILPEPTYAPANSLIQPTIKPHTLPNSSPHTLKEEQKPITININYKLNSNEFLWKTIKAATHPSFKWNDTKKSRVCPHIRPSNKFYIIANPYYSRNVLCAVHNTSSTSTLAICWRKMSTIGAANQPCPQPQFINTNYIWSVLHCILKFSYVLLAPSLWLYDVQI